MSDPYGQERELEQAAHERGEIDSKELFKRLAAIDREEFADAQERAAEAYDRSLEDSGFGRF